MVGEPRGTSTEAWATTGDQVRLSLPAEPGMLRLARIAASGIVGRLGFTVEAIEDVKLAVDELCWAITGIDAERSTLTLVCTVLDDGVQIAGHVGAVSPADGNTPAIPVVLSSMTTRILDRLVDSYEVLAPTGADGPGFRLVKRRT